MNLQARVPAGAGRRRRRPAWPSARWPQADAADAQREALYDLPRFGNVSPAAHDRLPCAVACRSTSASRASTSASARMQGQLPHLVGEHLLKAAGMPPGTRAGACLHLPRLRGGRAALRQGRRLRAPRHAGQAAEGEPAGRAAARRRRHLAGLGHRAVDQRPGHGRRLQAARRRRDDRPLGIHLRHGAREGNRREGLRGQHRFPGAERQDRRLRRPGVQALRDARDQRRAGGDHRPGLSRTRRSPTRATSWPTGPSASRTRTCRRWSTRRAPRARRWSCCCRTTAWTST